MNEVSPKVAFYVSDFNKKILEVFHEEIQKLLEHKIEVTYREPLNNDLLEACVNGYCVAGVDDIKHELNSLISS